MRALLRNRRCMTFAFTAMVGVALAILAAPSVHASEPPIGDCFNGVLSSEPLNCYLVEQAQEHEIIDIDAIYDVSGVLLFIYIAQTDPDWDRITGFFRTTAEKFMIRWPDSAFQQAHAEYYSDCVFSGQGAKLRECLLEWTRWDTQTFTQNSPSSFRLPYSPSYTAIIILPGGREGRRAEEGWAAFREVWPSSASGASGASGGFDVSDVDLTNFPDFQCRRLEWRLIERGETCEVAKAKTQAIADRAGGNYADGKLYVQFKNPPKDEQELEKLKEALHPRCRWMPVCTDMVDMVTGEITVIATAGSIRVGTPVQFHGPLANSTSTLAIMSEDLNNYHNEIRRLLAEAFPNDTSTKKLSSTGISRNTHKETGWEPEIIIVPVTNSHVDLMKYEEILNRFVSSRGNTVGILSAEVGDNAERGSPEDSIWTVAGPGKPGDQFDPYGGGADPALIRSTLVVYAYDAQTVSDALPELLPALGIPLDAVGVVVGGAWVFGPGGGPGRLDTHRCPGSLLDCLNFTPPVFYRLLYDVLGVPGWVPMWVNISAAAAITLVVLGSVGFTASRMVVGTVRFARRRRQG